MSINRLTPLNSNGNCPSISHRKTPSQSPRIEPAMVLQMIMTMRMMMMLQSPFPRPVRGLRALSAIQQQLTPGELPIAIESLCADDEEWLISNELSGTHFLDEWTTTTQQRLEFNRPCRSSSSFSFGNWATINICASADDEGVGLAFLTADNCEYEIRFCNICIHAELQASSPLDGEQ